MHRLLLITYILLFYIGFVYILHFVHSFIQNYISFTGENAWSKISNDERSRERRDHPLQERTDLQHGGLPGLLLHFLSTLFITSLLIFARFCISNSAVAKSTTVYSITLSISTPLSTNSLHACFGAENRKFDLVPQQWFF